MLIFKLTTYPVGHAVIFVALASSASHPTHAADPPNRLDTRAQTLAKWVEEADNSYDAALFLGTLTQYVLSAKDDGRDELALLAREAKPTLALPLQWYLQSYNGEERRDRFILEIAKVTGRKPPAWWAERLDGRTEALEFEPPRMAEQALSDPLYGFLGSADAAFFEVEGKLAISGGGEKVIDREGKVEKWLREGYRRCTVYMAEERCFVAVHTENCRHYPLICLSTDDGRCLWVAEVWAAATENWARMKAANHHDIAIEIKGETLLVFGAARSGPCYVEAFDAETGAAKFRFCTNGWGARIGSRPAALKLDGPCEGDAEP